MRGYGSDAANRPLHHHLPRRHHQHPDHIAADLTALAQAGHYTLTTSYDVAAFPHSGYPDVASYLLSDSMAGDVLVGLVLYPLVLSVVALLIAGLGRGSGASVTVVLR